MTDMNEFRLYWFDKGYHQSLRFTIHAVGPDSRATSLISSRRSCSLSIAFLFRKVFHRTTLISDTWMISLLLGLIGQQRFRDRELEGTFYSEYRKFRERLYLMLLERNGEGTPRYPGTHGRLIRFAQKILDRCIFIFFCEDMGQALLSRQNCFGIFSSIRSKDPYFDPDGTTIWQDLCGFQCNE